MNRRLTRAHLRFNPFNAPGLLFMADGDDDKGGGGGAGDDDKGDKGGKGGSDWTPPSSQADLDRIITDRVARERGKFADYDDLKSKAAAHDKAIEDAKGENEKAIDAARKEGNAAGVASVTEAANNRLIGAEARALAAEGKWRISAAAVVKQLDLTGIKVAADGTVDEAAIKVALTDLAKNEPGLVDDGKGGKPKPDRHQGDREDNTSKADDGRAEALKRFGKPAAAQQ